jgi:hypothetical protein
MDVLLNIFIIPSYNATSAGVLSSLEMVYHVLKQLYNTRPVMLLIVALCIFIFGPIFFRMRKTTLKHVYGKKDMEVL